MALALAFKGRTHALSLGEQHEALTLPQLSSLIEQVLPEVQGCSVKLLVPGRKALQLASSDASMLCKDAGLVPGVRVMVLATSQEAVQQVQAAKEQPRIAGFDHELRMAAARRGTGRAAGTPSPPAGQWTFADYQSWQAPALYPSPAEALHLLHRLAADRGIQAVMARYQWRVGLLSELPPQGKVGISPVCVLGLNVNRGQEIKLRLRTDDLRGFRKYDKIRETLIHELAHMVHDEHDNAFKALNSQLRREVLGAELAGGFALMGQGPGTAGEELGTSHWGVMGDDPSSDWLGRPGGSGGPRVLGGSGGPDKGAALAQPLPPRLAAAAAALRRNAGSAASGAHGHSGSSGGGGGGGGGVMVSAGPPAAGSWGAMALLGSGKDGQYEADGAAHDGAQGRHGAGAAGDGGDADAWRAFEHEDAETAQAEEAMRRLEAE